MKSVKVINYRVKSNQQDSNRISYISVLDRAPGKYLKGLK